MVVVDVQRVASDLNALLQQVEQGEIVVIAVRDRPVAELRAVSLPATESRPTGLCAGEFIVPDDFDEPLSADILTDFEAR